MATTRGSQPPAEGGRVVVMSPREMAAAYRDIRLTRDPLTMDLAVAFDVARQAHTSVAVVLGRMGHPSRLTDRYRDVFPGREAPKAVREPSPDPRIEYDRQVAARQAREDREFAAWEAEQESAEPTGVIEKVVAAVKHVRFSQSPAGQRARRARRKAKELNISFEEAEALMAARRRLAGKD